MIKTALIRLNQPLLINFNLYDQICQYNTKTFCRIGPMKVFVLYLIL